MIIKIDYMPPNWNDYITMERANKYKASKLKKDEKQLIMLLASRKRYTGKYPVQVTLRPHYSALRQDLDNFRYKGILDGLVSAGVLVNDNLRHIQRIVIEPIFDKAECVEIEIKEL